MVFTPEQRKAHYEANKEIIKQKQRERYLTQKGQVEQNPKIVLPENNVLPELEVEQKKQVEQSKVEQKENVNTSEK